LLDGKKIHFALNKCYKITFFRYWLLAAARKFSDCLKNCLAEFRGGAATPLARGWYAYVLFKSV